MPSHPFVQQSYWPSPPAVEYKIGFDCPGSPGWFQVSYEARLPVCAELLADPQAVCWEADRIASAGSAWGANGAPFTLWLPTYTDSLTWLGSPGCATTVEEAVSIATSEGSFGKGEDPTFEQINIPYDLDKWFTLLEVHSGKAVRVADCEGVASYTNPADLDGAKLDAAFAFARDLDRFEAIQLALEVETHRGSDATAMASKGNGNKSALVAWGANLEEPGANLVTCAYGAEGRKRILDQRHYTFDATNRTMAYREDSYEFP